MKYYMTFIVLLFFISCKTQHPVAKNENNNSKPNILWIVTEDISPTLSMYGDSTAKTPNLDALASEGTVYTNVFTTAGVCAPSRSALITGVMQSSIGTMHMRTAKDVFSWGKRQYKSKVDIADIEGDTIKQYSTVIPGYIKCFPEYLRQNGYYCTNNAKTDYQFAAPLSAWDENDWSAHWRHRPEGKPFFAVFNIGLTHESRLWKHADKPLTVNSGDVFVPPYLPDTKTSRKTVARHYSNVELMDKKVGEIIEQLKEDGLYDNTIIFFYSDHGGPLPRQKREVYDSGLKVPLIIKNINSSIKGYNDRLISFLDFAPTILSIAGIKAPSYMQGNAFLGKYKSNSGRKYIYAGSDRLDECTDRIRTIRNKRYLYVRNYFPQKPGYEDLRYRKNIPMMPEMLDLKDEGKLDSIQMEWFVPKSGFEELYDCKKDPYDINNIAGNPDYNEILDSFRNEYLKITQNIPDLGMIPEAQLIDMMWPDGVQPNTENPEIEFKNGKIFLSCNTSGASISYLFSDNPDKKFDFNDKWLLYTKPLSIAKSKYIYVVTERIGYRISKMKRYDIASDQK
ncbi:MAG TPA: sulfatase [Bacteroidetes bacterium]|nr:sulfatase [Bacteroidota bacterium]